MFFSDLGRGKLEGYNNNNNNNNNVSVGREGSGKVKSSMGDILCPPAMFSARTFDQLSNVSGDAGAKKVFNALDSTERVSIPDSEAIDIDTIEDLARAASTQPA